MKTRTYIQIPNDADVAQARLDAIGNTMSAMKKSGVCDHGSLQGNKLDSTQVCRQCGAKFATFEDAAQASSEAINNFRNGE